MKSFKVYVKDREVSTKVQKHAFQLGYRWPEMESGDIRKEIAARSTQASFLFFAKDGYITFEEDDLLFFKSAKVEELTAEEFLQLEREAVGFNMEPFTKVLVKEKFNEGYGVWYCDLFSHTDDDGFVCISRTCDQIIEYTPDLESYIGTKKKIKGAVDYSSVESGKVGG